MLVVFSAVGKTEHSAKDRLRRTKSSSTVRNPSTRNSSGYRSEDSFQLQPEFALEGKPIYLQQRLSLVSPIQDPRNRKKTYACFIEQPVKEKTIARESKVNTKRISAGARRASIRRREEQQKPSTEVVYQQKTRRKGRGGASQRQPLAMSVMSLPGKHLPRYCSCEETCQVLPTTEEAKATLKRLLASRNHESMMSEPVSGDGNKQESAEKGGLLEKPAYLEDTYDYLFNRHVQTLNGVIKRQEQEKLDEANELNQQKYKKQIIQLCCRDGGDNSAEEDTSVIIGSAKSSTRQNSSTTLHGGCDSRNFRSPDVENNCCNNNHRSSCSCATEECGHQCSNRPMRVHDNCATQNSPTANTINNNRISVNLVTSQIQELELEELDQPKPVIIFNHVPTSSEIGAVSMDSEEHYEQKQAVVSPPRSRSPTPLLEVPFPVKDLNCEMKRPPIN